jgi:hypothetical protein
MAYPLLPQILIQKSNSDEGLLDVLVVSIWFCLYLKQSSDIAEIYRNSEGTFDIVADDPSDVPPQGNWPTSQDALLEITGIIRKKGA